MPIPEDQDPAQRKPTTSVWTVLIENTTGEGFLRNAAGAWKYTKIYSSINLRAIAQKEGNDQQVDLGQDQIGNQYN